MGFFDTVHFEIPLPGGRVPDGTGFQTKHLGRCLARYTLTGDGRLIRHDRKGTPARDAELDFHGDMVLIGRDEKGEWIECVARFTHGRLEWLRMRDELTEAQQRLLELTWPET